MVSRWTASKLTGMVLTHTRVGVDERDEVRFWVGERADLRLKPRGVVL